MSSCGISDTELLNLFCEESASGSLHQGEGQTQTGDGGRSSSSHVKNNQPKRVVRFETGSGEDDRLLRLTSKEQETIRKAVSEQAKPTVPSSSGSMSAVQLRGDEQKTGVVIASNPTSATRNELSVQEKAASQRYCHEVQASSPRHDREEQVQTRSQSARAFASPMSLKESEMQFVQHDDKDKEETPNPKSGDLASRDNMDKTAASGVTPKKKAFWSLTKADWMRSLSATGEDRAPPSSLKHDSRNGAGRRATRSRSPRLLSDRHSVVAGGAGARDPPRTPSITDSEGAKAGGCAPLSQASECGVLVRPKSSVEKICMGSAMSSFCGIGAEPDRTAQGTSRAANRSAVSASSRWLSPNSKNNRVDTAASKSEVVLNLEERFKKWLAEKREEKRIMALGERMSSISSSQARRAKRKKKKLQDLQKQADTKAMNVARSEVAFLRQRTRRERGRGAPAPFKATDKAKELFQRKRIIFSDCSSPSHSKESSSDDTSSSSGDSSTSSSDEESGRRLKMLFLRDVGLLNKRQGRPPQLDAERHTKEVCASRPPGQARAAGVSTSENRNTGAMPTRAIDLDKPQLRLDTEESGQPASHTGGEQLAMRAIEGQHRQDDVTSPGGDCSPLLADRTSTAQSKDVQRDAPSPEQLLEEGQHFNTQDVRGGTSGISICNKYYIISQRQEFLS